MSRSIDVKSTVVVCLFAAVIGASVAANWLTLSDRNALWGWSPIDWVNHLFMPAHFERDFASGIENYRYSFFMHVYPALYQWGGVPPALTNYVVVGLEIALLGSVGAWFARRLLPDAGPIIPAIVGILLIASSLPMADLSRIATRPFFAGLFYNVADAARLVAIACAWQRRWFLAALALAFATATHPIMGGLAAVFIGVVVVARGDLRGDKTVFSAAAVYVLLSAGWLFGQSIGGSGVGTGAIPVEDWIGYTTLFSMHWYAYQFGSLTELHGQHLLPLVTFAALFYFYLPRVGLAKENARGWGLGVAALIVVACLGVLFSTFSGEPVLVKLNLTRACKLLLWVGLPVVAWGLVNEILYGEWWRRVVGGVLLLSPFLSVAVVPALPALALMGPTAIGYWKSWRNEDWQARAAAATALALLVVVVGYLAAYHKWSAAHYVGGAAPWVVGIAFAAVLAACRKHHDATVLLLVLGVVAGSALWWVKEDYGTTTRKLKNGSDFMAAQLWAKEHTEPAALFFVDPMIYYGWRDYSERSSFGNVREWLHTSWLYDSNVEAYQEGRRRFAELGVDLGPYLHGYPTFKSLQRLMKKTKTQVYCLDDEWRRGMTVRYGIQYFVLEKDMLGESKLERVYENGRYVILAAERAH